MRKYKLLHSRVSSNVFCRHVIGVKPDLCGKFRRETSIEGEHEQLESRSFKRRQKHESLLNQSWDDAHCMLNMVELDIIQAHSGSVSSMIHA